MNLTASIIKSIIKRKIATAVLITASLASFATLGDGGKKGVPTDFKAPLKLNSNSFSLRSGYNYRSNDLFYTPPAPTQFLMLNTVATYQKGNVTFVMPLRKKVLLEKIKFNPAL